MGGAMSRRKGYTAEREIVLKAKAAGLAAHRVPLSGAQAEYKGDIILEGQVYESKRRRRGFASIYKWLGDNHGLVIRDDHAAPLVVLRLDDYLILLVKRDAAGVPALLA